MASQSGGSLKALAAAKWQKITRERVAVLRGREQDPFDVYEWLDSLHLYCRMRPYYFFLAAARQEAVDRNIPVTAPGLQELHPAITPPARGSASILPAESGDQEHLLKEEIEWMEYISRQRINRSRQHYIRFTLPVTYRRLLHYGIDQDYSMGYGSINGFRASVASNWTTSKRKKRQPSLSSSFLFYGCQFLLLNNTTHRCRSHDRANPTRPPHPQDQWPYDSHLA